MKYWVLTDSRIGNVWNWRLYAGNKRDVHDGNLLGERVVLDLTKDLWNKGHCVYFDKLLHQSVTVCTKLLDNGTGSCGTACVNRRGIPHSLEGYGPLVFNTYEVVQTIVSSIQVGNTPIVHAVVRSLSVAPGIQQQLIVYASSN